MLSNNISSLTLHMNEVEKYKRELESLSERWDLLTLLGQMSNVDMDMPISAVASKGYREYKTQDNYTNEVIAIVFTEITDSCDGS